ncbi:MAG: pyruvate dehydrogenase complex dihydrolipoamide acetyltransferase [Bacteroidota bacterium]
MAEIIRMPRMSDTMEEGVIVEWLKAVGDAVEPGDVLAEVETDKATMELESYHEGVLLHIGIKEGAVPVNGILAVIGEEGEDFQAALAAAENEGSTASANGGSAAPEEEAAAVSNEPVAVAASNHEAPAADKRIKASPLARSMATEQGLDLSQLTGSGDNGRIVKRDIEAYLEQATSTPATTIAPAAPAPQSSPAPVAEEKPVVAPFVYHTGDGPNYEDVRVSQMRKTIARRLGESKFSAPHFYLTVEINMDKVIVARKQINEIAPTRISFNDFVVKACAAALRMHPAVNSSWMGDTIRVNKDINIGVAVAVEEGLLVPVIRHADMKTLSQIDVEVRELAAKAKDRKLQPQEMQGNTFTVSNLGMFGIEEFTAIINPPDSCIMAVGSIVKKPVVVDGELAVGSRMKVTLSCDHRVVDGATGAKFLQTFKEILEDPIRLLV